MNWPVGLGGKGNEGVSGLVKQTPGSIGYVELIYAENNKPPYASLQNKSGKFVMPNMMTVTAAAASAVKNMPDDFRVSITNGEGKEAYPISGFTYLLVYKQMSDAGKAKKLVRFLRWSMKDGQKFAETLFYAPLPKAIVGKIETRIGQVVTQ